MMLVPGGMSTRILGFGIIATGAVVLAIALIIGIGFPKFVYHENLKSACILNLDHPHYEDWVNETYWTNWNRVYYWELINKDDFLRRSAIPQLRQRGPYVYFEKHSKIDINFVSAVTQFHVWRQQIYNETMTKQECGASCREDDEITVLNLDYFRRVGQYGGDVNLTLSVLPEVVCSALYQLTLRFEALPSEPDWNSSRTFEILGALNGSSFDPLWMASINNTGAKSSLPREFFFGTWVGKNDTDQKAEVLRQRGFRDFNRTEMAGLYEVLEDEELYGDTLDGACALDWTPKNPTDFLFEFRDFRSSATDRKPCAFLMLLLKFKRYQEQYRIHKEQLENILRISSQLLCPDSALSCFLLPKDLTLGETYLSVIYSYVVDHLSRYVFYDQVVLAREDLVTTKTQKELARGRWRTTAGSLVFVPGVLEDFEDRSDATRSSSLISVYNCYDAVQAATSGLWAAYEGQFQTTTRQFPRASDSSRRISRSLRYQLGPVVNLTACGSYSLSQPYYSVFLPEFWRTVKYTKQVEHRKTVDRIRFDETNMDVDGEFVFDRGLQEMTGVNGYLSWVSLPHFLRANSSLHLLFNMTPSPSNHLSYRDFEPISGVMWRDVVRHQVSVGVRPDYVTMTRPTPVNVSFMDRPIPVHWVEKSSSFNEIGTEFFYAITGHNMAVSCGGLIGLSVIASVIMLLGVLAATVTVRDGKVMPIVEDKTFF